MKKLVYLLVLSLCMSGLSGLALNLGQPAWAAEESDAKQEKKAEKSKKSKKSEKSEKSDKEKKSKKSDKSEKAKEAVYTYDLNGNGAALLSKVIKDCRMELSLSKVKGIEGVSKGVNKVLAWGSAEDNKKDYAFTVLKDFKEAELRIKTKSDSLILRFKNGKKEKQTEVQETKAPEAAKDAPTAEISEKTEAPAEAQPEAIEAPAEKPAEAQPEEAVGEAPEKAAEAAPEDTQEAAPEQGDAQPGDDTPEDTQTEATDEGETGTTEGETSEGTDTGETGTTEGETSEGADTGETTGEGGDTETPATETSEDGQMDAPGDAGESEGETPQEGGEDAGDEATEEGTTSGEEGTEATDGEGGDALPEDAEAWFERDGVKQGGALKDVLALLQGDETLYVRTKSTVFVPKAPLKRLAGVKLLPDGEVFKGDYAVYLSQDNPADTEKPALIEADAMAKLGDGTDVYLWVAKAEAQPPEDEEPTDPEEPAPQLAVKAKNYVEAAWTTKTPQFTLSGIPEGKKWSYTAIVYDERFVPISGDTFIPTEDGVYNLQFAMLDEYGDILSVSDQYILWLDREAPETVSIEMDDETDYTMIITASDSVSGVARISLNSGKKWEKLTDDEPYVYTGTKEKTFSAGSIQIQDKAGNIFYSDEDYTLEEVEDEDEEGEGGGGGGGAGGSGESTPVPSHASGDSEEGVEYDALELEIPDEPMEQLTVGGEAMDLTLLLEAAQEPEAPVGQNQYFTASLRRWNGGSDDAPDTLLLSAELDANLGDQYSYDWRFNGEVYRMLANSGIKYVALQVGEDVAAFPTEGFTGGTKYTELKMLGVSTRRFDYTLTMKVDLNPGHVSAMSDSDFSPRCELSIRTEVENMNYELSSSPKSIMYFYNVYLGPEDMLDQPFGEYSTPN